MYLQGGYLLFRPFTRGYFNAQTAADMKIIELNLECNKKANSLSAQSGRY